MPRNLTPLRLDDFSGGLNTRLVASKLAPNQAQVARNVDLFDGSLKGTPDVGSSSAVNANYPLARWIKLCGGGSWQWSDDIRYHMDDGAYTYATTVGGRPQVLDAVGNTFDLGITPLSSLSWSVTLGGGTTYAFGITLQTDDGLESNMQNFDLHFASTSITFSVTWPSDVRVTAMRLWAATVTAGVAGLFYPQETISTRSTTSFAAVTTPTTTGTALAWTYGGYPTFATYTADHAPAPVLTRIADRIHAMAAGTAAAGSGVVVGAQGSILRWSAVGYPHYWPTVNSMALDHTIEAILAHTGYTIIFTTGGVYALSGNSDDAMRLERLDGAAPIVSGAGKSAVNTGLYGTLYLTREGVAVFDGTKSTILSSNDLAISDFTGLAIYDGGFANQKYYLFHSTGYIVGDLRDGKPRWTTSSTVINCCAFEDFKSPVVGLQQKTIPLTASATATGIRRAGFCSDGTSKVYLVGGAILETTGAAAGEVSAGTLYSLDTAVAAAWIAKANLGSDAAVDVIPTMTSNTAPSGVASASSEQDSSKAAWKAFDKVNTSVWQVSSGTTGWLQYQFATSQVITKYTIVAGEGAGFSSNNAPQAWTFLGSATGAFAGEETTLDTQTAQTSWSGAGSNTYTFANSTAYAYYRLNITTGVGGALLIGELSMFGGNERADLQAVYVNGKIYAHGGVSLRGTDTYFSSTLIYTASSDTWAVDSTASGPGAIRLYAAAADTSGADTSGFWVHGGWNGSAATLGGFKYTISGPSWATLSATNAPTLAGHRMAYVPGTIFADAKARLFVFGGSTDTSNANVQPTVYAYNLTDNTWASDADSEATGRTSAEAAGVAARQHHVWAYNTASSRIYLHGGIGSGGSALADLWEFNPRTWADAAATSATTSRVNAWVNTSGAIVNVEDRYYHGGAFLGTSGANGNSLYLAGGSSQLDLFNSDFYRVVLSTLTNATLSAGLYVLKPSDGGNIRRLEGGSAQAAYWQTGDIMGANPAAYKHLQYLRADYIGDVNLAVAKDGGSLVSLVTLSSATRTQTEQWLPASGSSAATGRRLSLQILCTNATMTGNSSSVAGVLFGAEIDMSEEPSL